MNGLLLAAAEAPSLDPLSLMLQATGVGRAVLGILLVFSVGVWVVAVLKLLQLRRLRTALRRFEAQAEAAASAEELAQVARVDRGSPGARVVLDLLRRWDAGGRHPELLSAVAKRSIASEQQRASALMSTLSSIASSAPFIGLLGTVWGIMDAFMRIGVEKSASLPVVAPAIGEALIATAMGLVAAIPATIAYNFIDQRIGDLLEELTTAAETWVQVLAGRGGGADRELAQLGAPTVSSPPGGRSVAPAPHGSVVPAPTGASDTVRQIAPAGGASVAPGPTRTLVT